MSNKELLKRLAISYSPLSQTIRIGWLDADGTSFLHHKDLTKDAVENVFLMLRDKKEAWDFRERDSGTVYELITRKVKEEPDPLVFSEEEKDQMRDIIKD